MTATSTKREAKPAQTKPEAGKAGPEVTIEGQDAPKAKPEPEPCLCGCGKPTVTTKASFIAGHDARLASRLVNAALEAEAQLGRMPTRDEADSIGWAHQEIAAFGWTSKLDKSRESRAKKAEAKSRKATRKSGLALTDDERDTVTNALTEYDTEGDEDAANRVAAILAKLAELAPATEDQEEAEQAS
jgi:hypothetical protein